MKVQKVENLDGYFIKNGKFCKLMGNCNGFDWTDFWASVLGGITGEIIRLFFFSFIKVLF